MKIASVLKTLAVLIFLSLAACHKDEPQSVAPAPAPAVETSSIDASEVDPSPLVQKLTQAPNSEKVSDVSENASAISSEAPLYDEKTERREAEKKLTELASKLGAIPKSKIPQTLGENDTSLFGEENIFSLTHPDGKEEPYYLVTDALIEGVFKDLQNARTDYETFVSRAKENLGAEFSANVATAKNRLELTRKSMFELGSLLRDPNNNTAYDQSELHYYLRLWKKYFLTPAGTDPTSVSLDVNDEAPRFLADIVMLHSLLELRSAQ